MRKIFLCIVMLTAWLGATTKAQQPVQFNVQQKQVSPTELDIIFTGKIAPGWHVYSTGLPDGGPTAATLTTEHAEGIKAEGKLKAIGNEIAQFDEMFSMKLRWFENSVKFVQRYKITGKTYNVKGFLEYGACNDESCMPPTQVEFSYTGKGPENASEKPEKKEKEEKAEATEKTEAAAASQEPLLTTATAPQDSANIKTIAEADSEWWAPVIKELKAFEDKGEANNSWLYIFIMGFLGGLLALFTPCVWPIIPMTVGFFLKRAKDKKQGLKDAITYGISIIVIYMALAVLITLIFGAQKLNELATDAVFNVFFFLLLVVFALSFFGWFELRLPSKWADKVDSKASNTSGLLSIFLMAFTLALVSFSCTAPIVGLLLVEASTSGNSWVGPALGMFGFALALALPFTLFAIFPTWLKQAPKSGSWMNIIKITLGFIELAFAFKFLSVADLAYGWRILDREVFLAIWIVIFTALGLYLMGMLHFRSDGDEKRAMPVPCIMLGMMSLTLVVYMIPGLWGAPCKAVGAFTPPMNTQDFNLYHNEVHARFTDFDEGMAAAAKEGKPVMLDFTGFGCVNCRKMEQAVWTDARVADILNNDYVLISLVVDDRTKLPQHQEVEINGRKLTLRTTGDKWKYLEESKFGALTQPFYVLLDNEGKPLNGSYSYKEDIKGYIDFLETGLKKYRQ
ncbi:MAG: thioredoxin family protein [Prevotella sp.]|nr:thioredoxin family protein [Prevotella sp.]